jgi:EAL domain-containing protein (putative c-di-GMP-specific phosphodiesterase class I)
MGRSLQADLTLNKEAISRLHAEIFSEDGHLYIRDLNSTNGTHVNTTRIDQPTSLFHGDVIHIAEKELRLIDTSRRVDTSPKPSDGRTFIGSTLTLSKELPYGVGELEQLLEHDMLQPVFQDIQKCDGSIYGYELLGRGSHPDLPSSPGALFKIAESTGLEIELSERMRDLGLAVAAANGLHGPIYVNTHPREMTDQTRLFSSLRRARGLYPDLDIMLEIHEQAMTTTEFIRSLKCELTQLNIGLAFDDFGVGQSRLLELIEATPDVLKFDLELIHSVHRASVEKVSLIKKLLEFAREMQIATLAECVSNVEEYQSCLDLGFDLLQGFYLGKPRAFA